MVSCCTPDILWCSPETRALAIYHLVVVLWGFTAILGKLISYDSFTLVWHRMTLAAVVFSIIPNTWYELKEMSWGNISKFIGIGIIVCCHWLSFYGSIKLGDSATVVLACMGSTSFFTAVLDPLIGGVPVSKVDLFMGVVVLFGLLQVYLSLPTGNEITNNSVDSLLNNTAVNSTITSSIVFAYATTAEAIDEVLYPHPVYYGLAVASGILAAFLGALFSVLNKLYIDRGTPLTISFLEMGSGSLLLTVLVPLWYREETKWYPSIDIYNLNTTNMMTGEWDLIWVAILAVFCTNTTVYFSTYALRFLSAFNSSMAANLEPIYGIILGAVVFHENKRLNFHFYLGTAIIVGSIFTNTIYSFYCRKYSSSNSNSTDGDTTGDENQVDLSLDEDGHMIEMSLQLSMEKVGPSTNQIKQKYSTLPTSESHQDVPFF